MNDQSRDEQLLVLLGELQKILSDTLNSVVMQKHAAEPRYLCICAITVNQAAGGFYTLRRSPNKYAAKLLIRPMVEATINAYATLKQKGFLFQRAYTELMENKKGFPPGPTNDALFENEVKALEAYFRGVDPGYPLKRDKMSMWSAANIAGFTQIYDEVYRLYCRFTHGSIHAALGQLNYITDPTDTHFAASFVVMMLEQMRIHIDPTIPDLKPYHAKLHIHATSIADELAKSHQS